MTLHLHPRLWASDSVGDNVPQVMLRGFLRLKLALANHLFNEGVVVGQASQLSSPQQVATTVADMDQEQQGAEAVGHRDGGAHAGKFGVRRRLQAYLGISLLQRRLEFKKDVYAPQHLLSLKNHFSVSRAKPSMVCTARALACSPA